MNKLSLMAAILLTACASTPKCPTTEEEPVSMCRAEVSCGKYKASTKLGMILAGFNPTRQPNSAINGYNTCIDQNLSAQKANVGVVDQTMHCESHKISSEEIQTDCR